MTLPEIQPAVRSMSQRLTLPFARGADTLALALQGVDQTTANLKAYDFANHLALFNRDPDPRYILIAARDLAVETLVTVQFSLPGQPPGSVSLTVPAGTLAGTSFPLDLGAVNTVEALLGTITMAPPALEGTAADWWKVMVLLGNLARLLWVIGWERDHIRRQLERTSNQRFITAARGLGLDLIGYDLGVPRFPPLQYAFEESVIALYHLDDPAPGLNVFDVMSRYGGIGHHGTNIGGIAQAGVPGRFGNAFAFRQPAAAIEVPHHADFDITPAGFTVECFLKPDANSPDGHALAKLADPANAALPGWVVSVGDYGRGIPSNVRFLLSDGSSSVAMFADQTLPNDRFSHVAGVIDRTGDTARLFVDGRLVASKRIDTLGALNNTDPLRIGLAGTAAFRGVIDEVRLSRGLHTTFFPVLGESDVNYRHRLDLFKRWVFPTPENLRNLINQAVGPINSIADPFVLNDTNARTVSGSRSLTIRPLELLPGECIDAMGQRGSTEAAVCGTPNQDTSFDSAYLLRHKDARVLYAAPPPRVLRAGEEPPDTHRLSSATGLALNRLLDLLTALAVPGNLRVESAYDPRASDLRAVGRGLLLNHTQMARSTLAALVHRAGFSFVCHRADLGTVYASQAAGDLLGIQVTGGNATASNGFDLFNGQTIQLTVQPALPPDALYRWTTIACGQGRAQVIGRRDQSTVTLQALAPGDLVVKVEVARKHRTASGLRTFHTGLESLDEGQSISNDGALGIGESVAGVPDDGFHPAYLISHADPRVAHGSDVNTRRMQSSVVQRLNYLLDLIAGTGVAGQLSVVQAYFPGTADLRAVGRALTLQHPSPQMDAGRLGALAHAAGFTYVRRQGAQVLVRQAVDEWIFSQTQPEVNELTEGSSLDLKVMPQAMPQAIAVSTNLVYVANRGTDTVSEIDAATGRVLRAIKVGWRPSALALNPARSRLYTVDTDGNTVTAIDLATGNVDFEPAANGPKLVAHHPSPSQAILYVAFTNNTLGRFNANTLAPIGQSITFGSAIKGIAITPNGKELWVACQANSLTVVNTAPFGAGPTITLPAEPAAVAIAPDGARAYVTCPQPPWIVVIDAATRTVVEELQFADSPRSVAVSLDSKFVFVADTRPVDPSKDLVHMVPRLAAAPFLDLAAAQSIRARPAPTGLGLTADRLYVASPESNAVSVINPDPNPLHFGLVSVWSLGSGLGERLTWVLRNGGEAQASVSSTTDPAIQLRAQRAGPLLARAVYSLGDNPEPYTFEIRLHPALEANPNFVIRKDQYDLIMNILNTFHPIGVEVITRAIRERVIEVREGLLNAFPDYTYPNFRVRGQVPRPNQKD